MVAWRSEGHLVDSGGMKCRTTDSGGVCGSYVSFVVGGVFLDVYMCLLTSLFIFLIGCHIYVNICQYSFNKSRLIRWGAT